MTKEEVEEYDEAAAKRDVILHPTRLRILNALSPSRRLAASQISLALPDVPQASLYRHLKTLVEAGVGQAAETATPRGATEKLYMLPEQEIALTPEDFADANPEDLARYFTTFAGILLSHGRAFYSQADAQNRKGGSYSTNALYLTDSEFEYFNTTLTGLTALALSNQPGPNRRRRLFFTAILPDEE